MTFIEASGSRANLNLQHRLEFQSKILLGALFIVEEILAVIPFAL